MLTYATHEEQWHQQVGNFGGTNWRRGEGILGDGSHPVGSSGEDPI